MNMIIYKKDRQIAKVRDLDMALTLMDMSEAMHESWVLKRRGRVVLRADEIETSAWAMRREIEERAKLHDQEELERNYGPSDLGRYHPHLFHRNGERR